MDSLITQTSAILAPKLIKQMHHTELAKSMDIKLLHIWRRSNCLVVSLRLIVQRRPRRKNKKEDKVDAFILKMNSVLILSGKF